MNARVVAISLGLLGLLAACASEPAEVTPADYLADLQSICVDTTDALDALPSPPEQISVVDFATSAAGALDNEAERARALDVPDDLADDHRAFVRNTDEQVVAWRAIATVGDDSALSGRTDRSHRRVDPRPQRPGRRHGRPGLPARRRLTRGARADGSAGN